MKWKAARQQVLKISVEWLKRREESSERSWSPSVYEARGCNTVCRLIVWWFDLHTLRCVWVYYWILICVGASDLRWDVCGILCWCVPVVYNMPDAYSLQRMVKAHLSHLEYIMIRDPIFQNLIVLHLHLICWREHCWRL